MVINDGAFKVFRLDDNDWWAGPSLKACVDYARHVCGGDCYPDEGDWVGPIPEEVLLTKLIDLGDGTKHTLFEELESVLDDPTFDGKPFLLASTEW